MKLYPVRGYIVNFRRYDRNDINVIEYVRVSNATHLRPVADLMVALYSVVRYIKL